MTDESNAGLGNEPADDKSLDTIIGNAIEAQEAPPDTEVSEQKSGERSRDERGRFASKDTTADASEQEPAQAATTEAQQTTAEPVQQPIEPPARWTTDDKAKFAAWPRDVQQAVSERYKAIEADYTRKTQEAAEIRKTAEPWLNAVKPFEPHLQSVALQTGVAPHELLGKLISADYQLRTGDPQSKYQAFQQIAQFYGVDLAALARGEVSIPDPTIINMRQELSELRNWRTQFETSQQQQQTEQASLQIDTFANAKDEAGRPRYPHFERVRGIMGQMMAQGQAATLEDAYTQAIAPIQEAIAEGLRQQQQAADAQRKEALAKADRAAPVRSSGSQPNGAVKGKDLDSILWANIEARL